MTEPPADPDTGLEPAVPPGLHRDQLDDLEDNTGTDADNLDDDDEPDAYTDQGEDTELAEPDSEPGDQPDPDNDDLVGER